MDPTTVGLLHGVGIGLADAQTSFLLNHAYSYWFGLAAFVVFCLLLMKFGIGPIVRALDARDAKIAAQLVEAEKTAAKAKELQAQLEKALAGAEAKIAEMIAEGRRDGEALKAKLVEDGYADIAAHRQKALRDIDAARHQALLDLRDAMADIAGNAAEKILRTQIDHATHRRLIDEAVTTYVNMAEAQG